MPAGTQTRRIVISVDTKGNREIQDLANKLGGVAKNTKSLAGNIGILKNAFIGYLSSLGIQELARMSDEMQNLSNRLKIVSRSTEDTDVTMRKLLDVANETKQSVGAVGEIYVRLASSLKSANASADSMLEITKGLINSFRVSGSTGTETTATIIQLSQAFASGTLRGQELRSVLLQNAELARLLRERFGKDLAKNAEAGLISVVEVLKLLRANQDRINTSAQTLTITFEQALTKATNQVQFALANLNKELGLSAKFAYAIDLLAEKFTLLLTVAGLLALTQLPALVTSLQAVGAAMLGLATRNPLIAALVAVSAIVVATNDNLTDFIDKLRNLGAWLVQLKVWALEFYFAIEKGLAKALFKIGLGSRSIIEDLARDLDEIKSLTNLATELGTPKYRPSPLLPENDKKKSDQEFADLIAKLEKLYGAANKIQKPKEILAELNAEFATGIMTIRTYSENLVNFQLAKVNKEFKEGKIDVFKYNEELRKIKETELNRELQQGILTIREYNTAVTQIRIDELNEKFEAGRIGLIEYNSELTKISQKFEPGAALVTGTASYIESVGTLSSNIADGVRQAFSTLEDNLVEFTKRGKFNFQSFTQAILDDLTRIIIRASIVQPLAQGLLNGLAGGASANSTGSSYNDYSNVAANGLAFDKGLRKFAKGGIVDSPTAFSYGTGTSRGLMGEAGPEAILPLARGKGGALGVQASVTPVTVNIINQSGSEVQQTESSGPNGEKTIDILITSKVRDGLMTGKFDTAMKSSFGLQRKGS